MNGPLQIRSLRALVWRYPLKTPVVTSFGTMQDRPMVLVRADPSDVMSSWTILRGDLLEGVNEALWAPDASFVVATFAPTLDIYDAGTAQILYFDGRPNVVLTPLARQMKWGP